MINKNESLAKASKDLMLKESFWGLFLMMLNKVWDDKFPTLGVSKNGINYQLRIGIDFWNAQKSLHQMGLLRHEVGHLAFFHIEMADRFPNKQLANISMDLDLNQYIDETWLPGSEGTHADFKAKWDPVIKQINEDYLSEKITPEEYKAKMLMIPARGILIKDYSELKLDLKAGTKYYYDKLQQASDKKDKTGSSGSSALDDLLDQMDKGEPTICDHSSWKEFSSLSEAEKKLMRSQIDFHLKEVAEQVKKSRGTIPSELAEYINGIDYKEPPKFDWKRYLRRFTGGSTKTYTKKLRRKFNKRYEDLPGLKIKTKRHVLVAIDTSGSVQKDELKEFFKEIYHISKNNTEVTVLQCDSAISNIAKYKKGFEDKIKIYGRGGTNFSPIIDYANKHNGKFTSLIVFTDGEAPAPDKCRLRTLWVHSSKSNINENLIGFRIKLN